MRKIVLLLSTLVLALSQSFSYGASDQAGAARLAPLLEQVVLSREVHQAAVEQFQADRQTLSTLVDARGVELQPIYAAAFKDYRDSEASGIAVSNAIATLNQQGISIFEGWRDEIGYLTDAGIKADNEAEFASSWQRYHSLIETLQQSEAGIEPVLAEMKANVIALKYKLDESTVAAKKPELIALGKNIEALIAALETSIASLDAYLNAMQ